MRSDELIEKITAQFREQVQQVVSRRSSFRTGHWLYDAEHVVEQTVLDVGRQLLEGLVEQLRGGHQGQWHEDASGQRRQFKDYRELKVRTRLGPIGIRRAKYESSQASPRGLCPLDAKLGLVNSCSEGLEELIALMSAEMTYAHSVGMLDKMLRVDLSPTKVQEVAGRWGRQAAEDQRQRWPQECLSDRVAIAIDAAFLRTSQRRCKRKNSRKQHFQEQWREAKIGVLYGLDRRGQSIDRQRRYVATLGDRDAFAAALWDRIVRAGADQAKVVVWLGDGAAWIWSLKDEMLPNAVEILDFVHARLHLTEVAEAIYGQGKRRQKWLDQQLDHLRHSRLQEVIAELLRLGDKLGKPTKRTRDDDPRKIVDRNIGYFQTNAGRMDYEHYRRCGYPIASGVVESACKQLVSHRLKLTAAMSWNESQAESILQLRALNRSGQWNQFWNPATAAA
jgi:hypothetical protein